MIKIATDVTADLSDRQLRQYQINLIPAWVQTPNGKVRTDKLGHEALMSLIADACRTEAGSIRTMPLDVDEYYNLFDKLLGKDDVLLFISTSRLLTPVYDLVCEVARRDPDRIKVFDSGGLSLWQGLHAIGAARLAAAGCEVDEVLDNLAEMQSLAQFYFIVDSLSYLHRGGRVNLAQYMIGSMLDLKPILMIQNGEVIPAGNSRGRERALIKMQLALLDALRDVPNVFMGIVHVEAADLAYRIADVMNETLRPTQTFITEAGPTVSLHGGPGAVGIAVCPIN